MLFATLFTLHRSHSARCSLFSVWALSFFNYHKTTAHCYCMSSAARVWGLSLVPHCLLLIASPLSTTEYYVYVSCVHVFHHWFCQPQQRRIVGMTELQSERVEQIKRERNGRTKRVAKWSQLVAQWKTFCCCNTFFSCFYVCPLQLKLAEGSQ